MVVVLVVVVFLRLVPGRLLHDGWRMYGVRDCLMECKANGQDV